MIEWRPAMSVGHSVVDDDHKKLLSLINAFEAATDNDQIESVLRELMDYTQTHFSREEALQRACRYPFYEAHHKAHEKLIHDVSALCRKWEQIDGAAPAMVSEIANFFRKWLIEHILKEDMATKPHLETLRRKSA
jgi:hemerythrin